jgi:hypothetical protein
MSKVSMAALAASIQKSCSFQSSGQSLIFGGIPCFLMSLVL